MGIEISQHYLHDKLFWKIEFTRVVKITEVSTILESVPCYYMNGWFITRSESDTHWFWLVYG